MPHTFTDRLGLVQIDVNEPLPETAPFISAGFEKLEEAVDRRCTSASRPASPYDGMRIFETDTKAFGIWDAATSRWLMYDSAWQNWTPVLVHFDKNVVIGNGFLRGRYFRNGKKVSLQVGYQLGTTTSHNGGTGPLQIVYPVEHAAGADTAFQGLQMPEGVWRGGLPGTSAYHGICVNSGSTNTFALMITASTVAGTFDTFVTHSTLAAAPASMACSLEYQTA